jgi:putative membrane protein
MRGLLLRWIINGVALWVAVEIVNRIEALGGIRTPADMGTLIVVAAIFGLVNALIRPVLQFLTCPFIVLTMGLFILVINALMLMLTSWLAGQLGFQFEVIGFGSALVGALIISVVSFALSVLIGDENP